MHASSVHLPNPSSRVTSGRSCRINGGSPCTLQEKVLNKWSKKTSETAAIHIYENNWGLTLNYFRRITKGSKDNFIYGSPVLLSRNQYFRPDLNSTAQWDSSMSGEFFTHFFSSWANISFFVLESLWDNWYTQLILFSKCWGFIFFFFLSK